MRIYRRGKVFWAQYRGRRVSLHVTDREAAERAFRELQRATVDPSYRPADETPLSVAIEEFAAAQAERGRSPASIRRTGASGSHLVRVLGNVPLATLTAADVDRYVSTRRAEGAVPLTVARELQALRGAWKIALRQGRVTLAVEALLPGLDLNYRPLDRHLTYDQITRLRTVLPPHRAAIVGFIVATAADLRSVTLAQLGDIALDAGTVLVRGSKNRHRWRTLPILPDFREWLREASSALPFAPWGNAVRDLAAACKRAGVPRVTPRDLRRSHAKILRAMGVEPSLVASMLGHADARMVERVYGRLSPEDLGRLVLAHAGTKSVQRRRRRRGRAA